MIKFILNTLNKAFNVPEQDFKSQEIPEVFIEGETVINVPNIGDQEAKVIQICVRDGELVKTEQALLVLETDKCSLEVPSPCTCKIEEAFVRVGSLVKENDPIFRVSPHS